jgi:hypothetical protein
VEKLNGRKSWEIGRAAGRRVADSVLQGEFEAAGQSEILYLEFTVIGNGMTPRCRLTRERFEIAFDVAAMPPAPSLPLSVLSCCWLPSAIARRWLESHGYRWAPHFEPSQERRTAHACALKTGSAPPSRERPFWPAAHVAVFEWLAENGFPAPGDGNQATLERWLATWLEDRGHEASESAVRRHVARCIKERRAELSA